MRNDVVKRSESILVRVTKIELLQPDVLESEFRNRLLTGSDRTLRQVYTQEVTFRVIECHGDQVAANTTADLQQAAAVN